jgi:dTDP-4-dehydrorhamnose 3,5-epimerase
MTRQPPDAARTRDTSQQEIAGTKAERSVTSDWTPLQTLIDGVRIKEIRNVPKKAGILTEIYRRDWDLDNRVVDQAFQALLYPGGLSAWHTHRLTTDRLFVTTGMLRIVLYDDRSDSPTRGLINEFRIGSARPGIVVVPPRVWHGVQNYGPEPAILLNLVDRAYDYDDPDHWSLPPDSELIPYQFPTAPS